MRDRLPAPGSHPQFSQERPGGRGLRPARAGWGVGSSGGRPRPLRNGVLIASCLLNREDETRVTARPACPEQPRATGGQCPRGESSGGQAGGSMREGQPSSDLAPGAGAPARPGRPGCTPGGRRRALPWGLRSVQTGVGACALRARGLPRSLRPQHLRCLATAQAASLVRGSRGRGGAASRGLGGRLGSSCSQP